MSDYYIVKIHKDDIKKLEFEAKCVENRNWGYEDEHVVRKLLVELIYILTNGKRNEL